MCATTYTGMQIRYLPHSTNFATKVSKRVVNISTIFYNQHLVLNNSSLLNLKRRHVLKHYHRVRASLRMEQRLLQERESTQPVRKSQN